MGVATGTMRSFFPLPERIQSLFSPPRMSCTVSDKHSETRRPQQ